jgi:hypothetical protein
MIIDINHCPGNLRLANERIRSGQTQGKGVYHYYPGINTDEFGLNDTPNLLPLFK